MHWKVRYFLLKKSLPKILIHDLFFVILISHTLRNLNDWTIQLGMTRRHSHSHYGQKIKVKKVIPHPLYNDIVAHDTDIALFQVRKKLKAHSIQFHTILFNVL